MRGLSRTRVDSLVPAFTRMRRYHKIAIVVVMFFLAVGIASGSTLSAFGVITGTADVEPALEIEDVDSEDDEVTITNNLDRSINGEEENVEIEVNGESEKVEDIVEESYTVEFKEDEIDEGDNVELKIDSTTVSEMDLNEE